MRGWHAGRLRGGPACLDVRLLRRCGANEECLNIICFLVRFGVVGVKPRWRGFQSRIWVLVGRWVDMVGMGEGCEGALWWNRGFLCIARIVSLEQRLVCLS